MMMMIMVMVMMMIIFPEEEKGEGKGGVLTDAHFYLEMVLTAIGASSPFGPNKNDDS